MVLGAILGFKPRRLPLSILQMNKISGARFGCLLNSRQRGFDALVIKP